MLTGAKMRETLSLKLVPEFVPAVEDFMIAMARESITTATREQIATRIAEPLLAQVLRDSGEAVASLSRDRLGIGVPQKSVRDQAREMGVTRARVYQLLEDCGKIMAVRWPEGRHLIKQLNNFADPEARALMIAIRQLFFPEKGDTNEDF